MVVDPIFLRKIINKAFDDAYERWELSGHKLMAKATYSREHMVLDEAATNFPGVKKVDHKKAQVEWYVALVADMRGSSSKLKTYNDNKYEMTGLKRVFFETSALLPAIEYVVKCYGGVVTEYLGDGVLAFFHIESSDGNEPSQDEAMEYVRKARDAGSYIVKEMRYILIDIMKSRYDLYKMDLGVGLAYGSAMITEVGSGQFKQAKALGECVFDATKVAFGFNEVYLADSIKVLWPKGLKPGIQIIRVGKEKERGVSAYRIERIG